MMLSLGALSSIYIISVYFLEDFEKLKNIFIAYNDLLEFRSHKIIDRGFPGGSVVKDPPANAGEADSIPGFGKMPWRRKWQSTPVFLLGESHEQRSLAGYRLAGYSLGGYKSVEHNLVTKQQDN